MEKLASKWCRSFCFLLDVDVKCNDVVVIRL